MIGQSNMAGRGRFNEVEEIDRNGKMFMLRKGRWQTMSEPVNVDRCASPYGDNGLIKCGIGLAPSFAECYDKKIGIASSEGLSDRGDLLHFNSASYRILGRRYFKEYQKIAK